MSAHAPTTGLLLLSEAAALLRVSRRGLYGLIERGLIEPVYIDSRPRFRVADLEGLIAHGDPGRHQERTAA